MFFFTIKREIFFNSLLCMYCECMWLSSIQEKKQYGINVAGVDKTFFHLYMWTPFTTHSNTTKTLDLILSTLYILTTFHFFIKRLKTLKIVSYPIKFHSRYIANILKTCACKILTNCFFNFFFFLKRRNLRTFLRFD